MKGSGSRFSLDASDRFRYHSCGFVCDTPMWQRPFSGEAESASRPYLVRLAPLGARCTTSPCGDGARRLKQEENPMRESSVCTRACARLFPFPGLLRSALRVGIAILVVSLLGATSALAQLPDPVGTWEWQRTVFYGWENQWEITPESEGYTIQLEFRPDSLLMRYRNGIMEMNEPYRVFVQDGSCLVESAALPWGDLMVLTVSGVPGERRLEYWSGSLDGGETAYFAERPPIGPLGACCLPDGRCAQAMAIACQAAGGAYQGDGSGCDPNPCHEPPGACCFTDLTCQYLTLAQCQGAGGGWLGASMVCDPNPCAEPQACCFRDDRCTSALASECLVAGGSPGGIGTSCDPNPCPQPEACCFGNGHCTILLAMACRVAGGAPQGSGTVCDPNPCPQPPGACCFADFSCQYLLAVECQGAGGTWLGMTTVCDPNPCVPHACCRQDGRCTYDPDWACIAARGTPQGNGMVCDPNPCPESGACCFFDSHCSVLTQEACQWAGGMWQGVDTVCDPNPCSLTGACCFHDGRCSMITHARCQWNGGTWQRIGIPCDPNPCAEVFGACCVDGACSVLTEAECNAQNGSWQGMGTTCGPMKDCAWPPSACCLPDGRCILDRRIHCEWMGGSYTGPGASCSPPPCENSSVENGFRDVSLSHLVAAPNPSAGESLIRYKLSMSQSVNLEVFNASGQLVRHLADGVQGAGFHAVRWDGRNDDGRELPTGVYFIHVRTAGGKPTGRLVLTR